MMKTTFNIDDDVMIRLKREATRQSRTMSEMIETALRQFLDQHAALAPLPTFDSGGAYVDVANRDALQRAMKER